MCKNVDYLRLFLIPERETLQMHEFSYLDETKVLRSQIQLLSGNSIK